MYNLLYCLDEKQSNFSELMHKMVETKIRNTNVVPIPPQLYKKIMCLLKGYISFVEDEYSHYRGSVKHFRLARQWKTKDRQ